MIRIDIGEFTIQEQGINGNLIATHAVLHVNSTTLVGTTWERTLSSNNKLGIVQSRASNSKEAKQSRIYHLISGVVYSLQLPEIIISHAMHVYTKLIPLVPQGTMLARSSIQAGLSIYIAAKQLKIVIYRDSLLARLGIDEKAFNRCLIQLKSIQLKSKEIAVQEPSSITIISRANAVMQEFAGQNDYMAILKKTYGIVVKGLAGMREDMKIAVLAFITLKITAPERASLIKLAKMMHCRISSLYNAITRVLKKIGINVATKLSQVDIGASMKRLLTTINENKINAMKKGQPA